MKHLVSRRAVRCGHPHNNTTRYDHEAKRLDLVLACLVCSTEKL